MKGFGVRSTKQSYIHIVCCIQLPLCLITGIEYVDCESHWNFVNKDKKNLFLKNEWLAIEVGHSLERKDRP